MKRQNILLMFLSLIVLVGCSSNKYIDLVKNGQYMKSSHKNAEVFTKCFHSCQWVSKRESVNQINVVFTGQALVEGVFRQIKVVYRIVNDKTFEVADFYINDEPVLSIEFIELVTNLYFR